MNEKSPLPSLEAFEKRLNSAKDIAAEKRTNISGLGMRLGAEFTAGVLVGTGIGVMLDRWLDSAPWMMIVCLCFGTAAGVRTMMATVQKFERQQKEV